MKKIILFLISAASVTVAANANEPAVLKEYLETVSSLAESGQAELAHIPTLNWESSARYTIVFSNERYYSFKAEEFRYMGGAHGMTTTVVGTFFRGKRLKLADLGDSKELEKQWISAACRRFKVKNYDELIRNRKIFKPKMTENFYLDDKGIHFIYDPYEIGCYAEGTIDIFVPWRF